MINIYSNFQENIKGQSLTPDRQAEIIRDLVIHNPNSFVMHDRERDLYWLTSNENDTRRLNLQVAVYHHSGKIDLSIQGASPAELSSNNRIGFYDHHEEFMRIFNRSF